MIANGYAQGDLVTSWPTTAAKATPVKESKSMVVQVQLAIPDSVMENQKGIEDTLASLAKLQQSLQDSLKDSLGSEEEQITFASVTKTSEGFFQLPGLALANGGKLTIDADKVNAHCLRLLKLPCTLTFPARSETKQGKRRVLLEDKSGRVQQGYSFSVKARSNADAMSRSISSL